MLARLRKARRTQGFTLIELLVVIIIIGILAAIAVPTLPQPAEKGWKTPAESELRNAAIIMEEVGSESANGQYPAALPAGTTFKQSDGVTVTITARPSANHFCLSANHTKLGAANSIDYHFESTVGQAGDRRLHLIVGSRTTGAAPPGAAPSWSAHPRVDDVRAAGQEAP